MIFLQGVDIFLGGTKVDHISSPPPPKSSSAKSLLKTCNKKIWVPKSNTDTFRRPGACIVQGHFNTGYGFHSRVTTWKQWPCQHRVDSGGMLNGYAVFGKYPPSLAYGILLLGTNQKSKYTPNHPPALSLNILQNICQLYPININSVIMSVFWSVANTQDDSDDPQREYLTLCLAAKAGCPDVVSLLLDHGATVDQQMHVRDVKAIFIPKDCFVFLYIIKINQVFQLWIQEK